MFQERCSMVLLFFFCLLPFQKHYFGRFTNLYHGGMFLVCEDCNQTLRHRPRLKLGGPCPALFLSLCQQPLLGLKKGNDFAQFCVRLALLPPSLLQIYVLHSYWCHIASLDKQEDWIIYIYFKIAFIFPTSVHFNWFWDFFFQKRSADFNEGKHWCKSFQVWKFKSISWKKNKKKTIYIFIENNYTYIIYSVCKYDFYKVYIFMQNGLRF